MQKLIQDLNQVDIKKKSNVAVPFSEKDSSAHKGVEKFLKKVFDKNKTLLDQFESQRNK